ncbi:hypothetical protein JR065_17150 [Xanthomonas sp. AmX2]|uniref:hypothetical protein n=1 Tax=Xanthomonas sp. TaxID=29446 RepID=UPI001980605A|nr:hypothetical protein [Xanthomonas sp.]MBN6152074.1 hypothetical protein [Xanthomonas sp.]
MHEHLAVAFQLLHEAFAAEQAARQVDALGTPRAPPGSSSSGSSGGPCWSGFTANGMPEQGAAKTTWACRGRCG